MNNLDPKKRYKNETGLYNYSNGIEKSVGSLTLKESSHGLKR